MASPYVKHTTLRFYPAEPFFAGTAAAELVPDVFPVAIAGRPYMLDMKSNQYARGFEQRVRDSQDISTAPGESSISTGGLWRRGEASWHLGAGQSRSDVADSQDYRFNTSKGINPWTKGQVTLLNTTKSALSSANTNLPLCVAGNYVYVGDGNTLKYTSDPFASSPTWTSVTTGAPAGVAINDITTDGSQIYVSYMNEGVLMTTPGGASLADHYSTSGGSFNYSRLGFAKGYVLAFHNNTTQSEIHVVPYAASTPKGTEVATIRDPGFVCAGIVGGQNYIYVGGYSNNTGLVYKLGIKTDGTVDVAVVALQLPTGEYITGIYAYLGYVLVGTNKGVRFCSTDSGGNLLAGSLIPTTTSVKGFTAEDRFAWFGWTNYDSTSGGLGRLDLSGFIASNTPAYASDLMNGSTNAVNAVATFSNKRLFTVSGVGVIVEDSANLVASGELVTGTYQWGIPDRKFIARIDTRSRALVGSITPAVSFDGGSYSDVTGQITEGSIESSSTPPQTKFVEARFRYTLARATATTGPTMTRWMARAYAAPARSEVFRVPVLLHSVINRWGKDYFFDIEKELGLLRDLIRNPNVVNYQENNENFSVIVEEVDFQPYDVVDRDNVYEGTAIITMRSV